MGRPAAAKAPEFRPKLDPQVEELRQELVRAFARRDAIDAELQRILTRLQQGGSSGGAPTDSEYLVCTADVELVNARVLTAGTNVTFDDSVAGVRTVNASGGVTDEHIQDVVGAMVLGGTGITATYDDTAGTTTIATTITQYTDELAQDAVGSMAANSATVSLTYADGAPSLTAAVIAGSIGTTQLADDGVTFAKLQNIATNRILGRDSAGSGNVEELTLATPFAVGNDTALEFGFSEWSPGSFYANPTTGDAVPVEVTPGFGLVWDGVELAVDPAAVASRVIYSVDFTALASNTFVNGTETIDGLNWTCAASSATTRTIFDILNGTGLRWTAPASQNTNFDSSSQTAAHIYIDLATFPAWRPEEDLIVEVQYTATCENGNDGFYFGVWGLANTPITTTSVNRMELANRCNSGGTQTIRPIHNASIGAGVYDVSATDVAMARFSNGGPFSIFYGTYSGGFPTGGYTGGLMQTTNQNLANPMFCSNSRLVLAFRCVSDASPTTAITIQRMRLRRGV